MEAQEKFDALVAEFGAEAVIAAIKGHVHPDAGTGCLKDTDCPHGYICDKGSCILNVGP